MLLYGQFVYHSTNVFTGFNLLLHIYLQKSGAGSFNSLLAHTQEGIRFKRVKEPYLAVGPDGWITEACDTQLLVCATNDRVEVLICNAVLKILRVRNNSTWPLGQLMWYQDLKDSSSRNFTIPRN